MTSRTRQARVACRAVAARLPRSAAHRRGRRTRSARAVEPRVAGGAVAASLAGAAARRWRAAMTGRAGETAVALRVRAARLGAGSARLTHVAGAQEAGRASSLGAARLSAAATVRGCGACAGLALEPVAAIACSLAVPSACGATRTRHAAVSRTALTGARAARIHRAAARALHAHQARRARNAVAARPALGTATAGRVPQVASRRFHGCRHRGAYRCRRPCPYRGRDRRCLASLECRLRRRQARTQARRP